MYSYVFLEELKAPDNVVTKSSNETVKLILLSKFNDPANEEKFSARKKNQLYF